MKNKIDPVDLYGWVCQKRILAKSEIEQIHMPVVHAN